MMEMLAAQSASNASASSNEMEIATDDDAAPSRTNAEADERQPLVGAADTNGASSSSGAASSSSIELPPELLHKSQSALTTLISFVTKEAPATKVRERRTPSSKHRTGSRCDGSSSGVTTDFGVGAGRQGPQGVPQRAGQVWQGARQELPRGPQGRAVGRSIRSDAARVGHHQGMACPASAIVCQPPISFV